MNFSPEDSPAMGGADNDNSDNTMAVLNTLGGGDVSPEGQPLGMDPAANESKLSGSTLAVGAVILVGVSLLFVVMKMTLNPGSTDATTAEAIEEIERFMVEITAAEATGLQGPIEPITGDSVRIIHELEADPTAHQVPAEQVQKNPFELVGVVRPDRGEEEDTSGPTQAELEERELERYKEIARGFNVDSISGKDERAVVFISGNMYRVGDQIADTGFTISAVEGLVVIIQTPADGLKQHLIRLRYE